MTHDASAQFEQGSEVYLRVDPGRRGVIMRCVGHAGGEGRYVVFHAPGDQREYFASQLVLVAPEPTHGSGSAAGLLEDGRGVDARTFVARIVAERFAHPRIDEIYALRAARIEHVPFQYKPVVRFLRSDRPRLLIADEVGVGKTIEAGLILKELAARQQLGNVLIVCPKALTTKWRAEMRRFDERFVMLDSKQLRSCIDETHRDGEWPGQFGRAIVALETLRTDGVLEGAEGRARRPGLLTVEPAPAFDLLIVDEAHHVRNPETNSYRAVRFLAEQSEAAVLLSATPVQTASTNLFVLLNLLRPDIFHDLDVFREMVEPNAQLTRAAMHLRTMLPADDYVGAARAELEGAAATSWGGRYLGGHPRFAELRARLATGAPLTVEERMAALRELEDLHTLAYVMNRTRRRDIGRFTVREPVTVSVAMTDDQQAFYERLLDWRRSFATSSSMAFVTDMLARQAASCLPAMLRQIRTGTGAFALFDEADYLDIDDADAPASVTFDALPRFAAVADVARTLAEDDPKTAQFLHIVETILGDDGPRKVLVFSFFLHTLDYLEEALVARGVRVGRVDGRIGEDDRAILRQRFRAASGTADAIDVLLSSEVGSEGLDYEFCDCLINYDIPWNPMRLEQRIGRIDRFGQTAAKVRIFNFVTPGTIEERIFTRCYERLGVFRDTIGDIEEVLGEVFPEVRRIAMSRSLTPEQQERQLRQAIDNVERRAEESRRLQQEDASFLGLDTVVEAETSPALAGSGDAWTAPLGRLVATYLQGPDGDHARVEIGDGPSIVASRLAKEGRARLLDDLRRLNAGRSAVVLEDWLHGRQTTWRATLDQREAAAQREIDFVTPVHPLAKAAVAAFTSDAGVMAAALSVRNDRLAPGRYGFLVEAWELLGARPDREIMVFGASCHAPAPFRMEVIDFAGMLAEAVTMNDARHEVAEDPRPALERFAYELRLTRLASLARHNREIVQRRIASLEAHYDRRLGRARHDLAVASDARIVRMRDAEVRRIAADRKKVIERLEERLDADIVTTRLAVALVDVVAPER